MISLKKYLDGTASENGDEVAGNVKAAAANGNDVFPLLLAAYRVALLQMGDCGSDACPALGPELKRNLGGIEDKLARRANAQTIAACEADVHDYLRDWGRDAAHHYQQKAVEVKGILLVMARTAESVGQRDERCAQQIGEVTARLKTIANLDDLSQIRESIERSASELKSSIDRMTAEGKAVIDHLRVEVSTCQAKLEEAEYIASCDTLTGLGSRLWTEAQIQRRIENHAQFCAAVIDIDVFKSVNDRFGHLVGDMLLKQFAGELRSACRSTDVIGRWGGDEFVLLLDSGLEEARMQTDRVRAWVCGNYTVQGMQGPQKLRINASLGLAQHLPQETSKQLLDRADAEMYASKAAARCSSSGSRR